METTLVARGCQSVASELWHGPGDVNTKESVVYEAGKIYAFRRLGQHELQIGLSTTRSHRYSHMRERYRWTNVRCLAIPQDTRIIILQDAGVVYRTAALEPIV